MATEESSNARSPDGSRGKLRREAIVPSSDRGRLAAIVATCSLAGLAGGMALSMLAETHRAARDMRDRSYHVRHRGPVTWLGVQIQDVKKDKCAGVVVTTVTSDGPADRVDFRKGDLLVSYEGHPICDDDHLIDMVRASPTGMSPDIVVRRGAAELTLSPTLSVMPRRILAALPPDQLR